MKDLRILLVDDEVEFVKTLSERLILRGLATQVATDGESALSHIESNPPNVVVLDVLMPGMDGLMVLQRIKASLPDLPVILLTGHGSTKDGIKGMQLGAADYLMKPIDIDSLIAKIREVTGTT